MTKLNLTKDVKGFNTYSVTPPDVLYSANLESGGGEDTITVPSSPERDVKWVVIFDYTPGTSVWVSVNITAEAPAGTTFATTTSRRNPPSYTLNSGDVIHLITEDVSAPIGVVMYVV